MKVLMLIVLQVYIYGSCQYFICNVYIVYNVQNHVHEYHYIVHNTSRLFTLIHTYPSLSIDTHKTKNTPPEEQLGQIMSPDGRRSSARLQSKTPKKNN